MSLFECRKMAFKNNQRVNPETGRKITVGGDIHQMLVKKYMNDGNVSPTKRKISPKVLKISSNPSPKITPKISPKPSPKSLPKIYEIHDNGGRPFSVSIEGKKVAIHTNKYVGNNIIMSALPILKYNTDEIFIGKSPKNAMTTFSGGYGPKFDGNSILLKVKDKYIYIGSMIYSFTAVATIKSYTSPVGNNDVPYPYATDTNNNTYLMIEHIILLDNKGKTPYEKYYVVMEKYPKYKGMEVTDWIVNNTYTTFHNTFNSSENYDRLTNNGTKPMYVIDKKGKLYKLTKKDYVEWVNGFNHQHQYKQLKYKVLVPRQ